MDLRTMRMGGLAKVVRATVAVAVLGLAGAGSAQAQDDPNPGALTFTGGMDVPSVYFFRGIRQESDPKLTLFPYGDIGIALPSGDGGLKSASINFGVWNSLHSGSSGTDAGSGLHYEEDFYATLNLGFGGGVGVGTTFTAYTSPNARFTTVKEISVKISKAHMINPYGLVAFEIGGAGSGQADGGVNKGTYVELGVAPSWPLPGDRGTIAIPVKLGLSAKDYYELAGTDSKFGFLDGGVLFTFPLSSVPSQYGAWNVHAGVNGLLLGDTTEAFNVHAGGAPKKGNVIALFGIGVSY